jgi:hypothetical protein
MDGVEVKGKKKKLIPVIIVSALMIILLMLMTPGDICIVTSTSGFISSTATLDCTGSGMGGSA